MKKISCKVEDIENDQDRVQEASFFSKVFELRLFCLDELRESFDLNNQKNCEKSQGKGSKDLKVSVILSHYRTSILSYAYTVLVFDR